MGTIGACFDPQKETSNAARAGNLGDYKDTPDGKRFRLISNGTGAALAPGKLVSPCNPVANHSDCAVASAAAIGATSVTITLGATAATKNQYAGGDLLIRDDAGEANLYEIESHEAADASASLVVYLKAAAGIRTALTTSTTVSLRYNKFQAVQVSPADAADSVIGVVVKADSITVSTASATYYGWAQTRGPCMVLNNGGTTVGELAVPGAVAGSVKTGAAATDKVVGEVMESGTDTEYSLVDLRLE